MRAENIKIRINDGPDIAGTLTIDTEYVDVTVASKSKPDMAWEHVDSRGHFHAYDKDGNLPTLESRSVHVDCACQRNEYDPEGWDCDGYDETIYVCAICDEAIEPKVITWSPIGREYMPGRKTWEVTVDADLERGDKVSVRVTSGAPADEVVLFGIATVVAVGHSRQFGDGPVERTVRLLGVSPLGERRAKRKVAA